MDKQKLRNLFNGEYPTSLFHQRQIKERLLSGYDIV